MIFNTIKNGIKEAFMVSGYSQTAKELLKLSERQLSDIGVSRELLLKGGRAYPWREEQHMVAKEIPSNVTTLRTNKIIENTPIMPRRPKAA